MFIIKFRKVAEFLPNREVRVVRMQQLHRVSKNDTDVAHYNFNAH